MAKKKVSSSSKRKGAAVVRVPKTRARRRLSAKSSVELREIKDNIDFADELIAGYERKFKASGRRGGTWSRFRAALDEIRRREDDSKLNLSIVGEFSAGKSTFINALLRQKLLVASPVQGTTLAGTVIEEGDGYALDIASQTRKAIAREKFDSASSLCARLAALTTRASTARRLKSVRVTLPTKCFCPDVRIIDTPGTNAVEAWHEDVTVRTIKEQSDLSAVLVTADRLVTDTVLGFVKAHLGPVLPQCVFVVTHIDRLETKKERDEILGYIRKRISSELGLKNPLVFPYASTLVLNGGKDANGELSKEEVRTLVKMSLESEKLLRDHTARMRMIVQAKGLMLLINDLYREVLGQVEVLSRDRQEKLQTLIQIQKADFKNFVASRKGKLLAKLEKEVERFEDSAVQAIAQRKASIKGSVLGEVRNQSTLKDLKDHLLHSVKPKFGKKLPLITSCVGRACDEMQALLTKLLAGFYSDLVEEYEHKSLVKLDVPVDRISYPKIEKVRVSDLSGALDYAIEQLSKKNAYVGGGAIAGAIAGSAVCPFFGTAIGGFLGGLLAGAIAAPDVSKVRTVCFNKLSRELDGALATLERRAVAGIKAYGRSICAVLQTEIDRYYASYRRAIDGLVGRERRKMDETKEALAGLLRDKADMLKRCKRLATLGKRLDALGGGISPR